MYDHTTEIVIELFIKWLEENKMYIAKIYTGNVNSREVLQKYLKEKNL